MSFDWKRLSTLDRAIVGGAGVAFIASFLPWYGVSVDPFGVSVSGWSAGFSAWAYGRRHGHACVRRADPVDSGRAGAGGSRAARGVAAGGSFLTQRRVLVTLAPS